MPVLASNVRSQSIAAVCSHALTRRSCVWDEIQTDTLPALTLPPQPRRVAARRKWPANDPFEQGSAIDPDSQRTNLDLAVIGAGPVGLGLALHAARRCRDAAGHALRRAPGRRADVSARSAHAGALARQRAAAAAPGRVGRRRGAADRRRSTSRSRRRRSPPALLGALARRAGAAHPRRRRRRADARRGAEPTARIVAPLQAAWLAAVAREPGRLRQPLRHARGGAQERRRTASRSTPASSSATTSPSSPRAASSPAPRTARSPAQRRPAAAPRLPADRVGRPGRRSKPAPTGRHGVRALHAPRPGRAAAAAAGRAGRAAPRCVWCVASDDDPVARLDDAQRVAVLNTSSTRARRPHRRITPLKRFALGLHGRAHARRRPHGAHRQRRADAAPGRRPGPQPRPARRLRAGARARAHGRRRPRRACCAASNGSARPTAGR